MDVYKYIYIWTYVVTINIYTSHAPMQCARPMSRNKYEWNHNI